MNTTNKFYTQRSCVLAWPGITLLALGQVDISPTVQTRDPARDLMEKALQCPFGPSLVIKSSGRLHRLSKDTINSAAAIIGSWRIDIGTVPACPCDPLTVTCNTDPYINQRWQNGRVRQVR